MHGYPIAAGAVLGLMAAALWHFHKLPRVQAFLFIASAFALTVGMTFWLDALAGLTATGTGLTVLLVILGLVVAVRVVRKTEDIASTLIAVAVGALVTLGPLALLQST